MKTLSNGVTIFNGTPHVIRFWNPDWPDPIEVESDAVINATVTEEIVVQDDSVVFVRSIFGGNLEGERIIQDALDAGADVIVGSLIAAQAYPPAKW